MTTMPSGRCWRVTDASQKARQERALGSLYKLAETVYDQLDKGKIPKMVIPLRTKSNINFDEKKGVWKYGKSTGVRTAKKLRGAKMLLRTMHLLDFIKDMIDGGRSSTLRELYYISEGWEIAKFTSQDESNLLAEDLEILTGSLREDFRLRPEEDGARVIGDLTLEEVNRRGEPKKFNCKDDVGDSGYSIPYNVEEEKLRFTECNADLVIAIETGGMFDRLVENRFDEESRAVLVHVKGQPARATRRFLKRLNEELDLECVLFADGDPWSFRIFASIAYGAIKTAHISDYLATPTATFLGITASDILNYDLPADDLSPQDVKALKDILNDPRFGDSFWKDEVELMIDIGKKAEQQALAKYGLDYVTDTYLPEKLAQLGLQ